MATYRIAEWIWSDIIELGPESRVVSVPALPGDDEEESPAQHSVNLEDIIDWQVQLSDRFIRGSFTTQAELRLAKQLGGRRSDGVGRADGRFLVLHTVAGETAHRSQRSNHRRPLECTPPPC